MLNGKSHGLKSKKVFSKYNEMCNNVEFVKTLMYTCNHLK